MTKTRLGIMLIVLLICAGCVSTIDLMDGPLPKNVAVNRVLSTIN
ncbi:MAG: hypothetical protein V3U84_02060 [Thiotrichaceae bacterium]